MKLRLERYETNDLATIGRILNPEKNREFICYTVERSPYGIPCRIPAGTYRVQSGESPGLLKKLREKGLPEAEAKRRSIVWWLLNVPGRIAIQIHIANKYSELKGCIAPVTRLSKNRTSGEASSAAFGRLTEYVGGFKKNFDLEVVDL